ncbi:MAG: LysM peptidoglycan-binding domain-containing protein, partial [Sandaracinaceae bacterium]|nr:LysM peptidoglycan-binding domain-containing protein [Sandaracinaceae bacterium]
MSKWTLWLFVVLIVNFNLNLALADFPLVVHVVKNGETLASIAEQYYGDAKKEAILVAENGLEVHGGARIVAGLRLVIPSVGYHRVAAGESWASIAEKYYGNPSRAFVLQEANPSIVGSNLPEGAEILLPYPLRHVADQRDTLERIAKRYYEDAGAFSIIRRFNGLRNPRLFRGQVVLVPLFNLILTEGARLRASQNPEQACEHAASIRSLQERVHLEIPVIQEYLREGHYVEAIAAGNRLLGNEGLDVEQRTSILIMLATAYIALENRELAVQALIEALRLKKNLSLDPRRVSPAVRSALEEARRRLASQQSDAPQSQAASN